MFSEKSSVSCRLIILNFSDFIMSFISSSFVARPRQIFQDAIVILLFSVIISLCGFDLSLLDSFCFIDEVVSTSLALVTDLRSSWEEFDHAFDNTDDVEFDRLDGQPIVFVAEASDCELANLQLDSLGFLSKWKLFRVNPYQFFRFLKTLSFFDEIRSIIP